MDILKLLEVTGWLIGIVVRIYGFIKLIDYRVGEVIRDPTFVKELSGVLRLSANFGEKEAIFG